MDCMNDDGSNNNNDTNVDSLTDQMDRVNLDTFDTYVLPSYADRLKGGARYVNQ